MEIKYFAMIAGLALAAPVAAQTALADKLKVCATIDADAKRLACYDTAVVALDGALAQANEARKVAAAARAKAAAEKLEADRLAAMARAEKLKLDSFGALGVAKDVRPETSTSGDIDTLEAAITEYFFSPLKELVVVLDNGQIWRQTSGEELASLRVGDRVTIKKKALSGFRMSFVRQRRAIDVRRFR